MGMHSNKHNAEIDNANERAYRIFSGALKNKTGTAPNIGSQINKLKIGMLANILKPYYSYLIGTAGFATGSRGQAAG